MWIKKGEAPKPKSFPIASRWKLISTPRVKVEIDEIYCDLILYHFVPKDSNSVINVKEAKEFLRLYRRV